MKLPKTMTNTAFVQSLMDHSKYGAFAQLFVMDALDKWSELVAKGDPATLDTPFISGHAWVGVASEIQEKMKERLG